MHKKFWLQNLNQKCHSKTEVQVGR